MTTFQEARAFLLKHRTDYDAAVKGFRWPDPGRVQLGAGLVRRGTGAQPRKPRSPGAVDRRCRQRQGNETFVCGAVSPLQSSRKFPACAGHQARRSSVAAARQRRAAVGDDAGRHEARRRRDPRDHALDAGRTARPARSRPGQGSGGVPGPGRKIRKAKRRQARPHRRRRIGKARRLAALRTVGKRVRNIRA